MLIGRTNRFYTSIRWWVAVNELHETLVKVFHPIIGVRDRFVLHERCVKRCKVRGLFDLLFYSPFCEPRTVSHFHRSRLLKPRLSMEKSNSDFFSLRGVTPHPCYWIPTLTEELKNRKMSKLEINREKENGAKRQKDLMPIKVRICFKHNHPSSSLRYRCRWIIKAKHTTPKTTTHGPTEHDEWPLQRIRRQRQCRRGTKWLLMPSRQHRSICGWRRFIVPITSWCRRRYRHT